MRCDSFDTKDKPVATITLLHKSLPSSVYGAMIMQQQTHWAESCDGVQCARRLAPAEEWPADTRLSDRWTHCNGGRYAIDERPVYIWYRKRTGDLPVFKEDRSRSSGMKALINCSLTFDHRKQPLQVDIPVNDAMRHVSDAVINKWEAMCEDLRSRDGRHRVGATLLKGPAKKVSALQPKRGTLHTMPSAIQTNCPETWHHIVLNSCVVLINFAREIAEQYDPESVSRTLLFCLCFFDK